MDPIEAIGGARIMALVVKDIVKNFGEGLSETKVLKGINFEVEQGEFVRLNGIYRL